MVMGVNGCDNVIARGGGWVGDSCVSFTRDDIAC